MFGLRLKRSIAGKEVILNDPAYSRDAAQLWLLNGQIAEYAKSRSLKIAA